MVLQLRRKSRLLTIFVALLSGLALIENVTADALGIADQGMQSAKTTSLEKVKTELQGPIDALRLEINAAESELSSFYSRDPQAKTDAEGLPPPKDDFAPKTIDQTQLKNQFDKSTQDIIDEQGKPLKEAISNANKSKDKKAAEDTFSTFATAAAEKKGNIVTAFATELKKLVSDITASERELRQQKAKIVSAVNYFIKPESIKEDAPHFAVAVRDALKLAGRKSIRAQLDSAPAVQNPASPSGSTSPTPAGGAAVTPPKSPALPSVDPTPAPAASPSPTLPPASPAPTVQPSPSVNTTTKASEESAKAIQELSQRMAKLERSLGALERSVGGVADQHKKLDALEQRLQEHDTVFGLRAKAAQEAKTKLSALEGRHQTWLVILSLLTLVAVAGGVAAFLKKGGSPARANTATVADPSARAGIQDLLKRVEFLEASAKKSEVAAETPFTAQPAGASPEELAAVSHRIEGQVNELKAKLKAEAEEVSHLRSLLVLDPGSREHIVQSLHDGLLAARSVAEPLLASVERLRGRLQLDNFRKITRDRVEPQMLQDACAQIRASLDQAQHQAESLPGQVYAWELTRLQQVLESVKGIERDVAKATTLRMVLVRLLLSTYRGAVLREPLDKAADLSADLRLFTPSDGPLRWTMECDGQGISADPADDRAAWHLRGGKRAGNRTVLFPLVTENGARLFAGVVTYEA
jgi:exonuclease VII small subunit